MKATPLTDAWHVSCKHTLFLLDHIPPVNLQLRHTPRSKTIASQFRHLAMIRLAWLENMSDQIASRIAVPDTDCVNVKELREVLVATEKALAGFFLMADETGKVKNRRSDPTLFLAYVIAHEAHHRGQILLYLKLAGKPFDKVAGYKLWEWKKST